MKVLAQAQNILHELFTISADPVFTVAQAFFCLFLFFLFSYFFFFLIIQVISKKFIGKDTWYLKICNFEHFL